MGLTLTDLNHAYLTLRSRLWEAESQLLSSNLNPSCSPCYFDLSPFFGHEFNYFWKIVNPSKRLACLQDLTYYLPQFSLEDIKTSHMNTESVNFVIWNLIQFPTFWAIVLPVASSVNTNFTGPPERCVSFLLEDSSEVVTDLVADFLAAIIKKQSSRLQITI